MDPAIVNADKLVDPQRWNLYVYTRNSPLVCIDPDGQDVKYVGGTADQQQAMKNAVETSKSQSSTYNAIFSKFEQNDKINLTFKVVPDKEFETQLSTVPDADKPSAMGDTSIGPGGVVSELKGGAFVVTEIDVQVSIRESAVNKKQEDKDRKGHNETAVEAITGHELGHANDEFEKHEVMKQEKAEAKEKNTPYHDRPYEKRADATLKQVGKERMEGKSIKQVRKQERFPD